MSPLPFLLAMAKPEEGYLYLHHRIALSGDIVVMSDKEHNFISGIFFQVAQEIFLGLRVDGGGSLI